MIYGNFKQYRCRHVDPNGLRGESPFKRIVGNSKYFPRKRDISFLVDTVGTVPIAKFEH